MKNFFTLTLCFLTLSLTAQEPLTYPFNPDANGDTFVGVSDVLEGISTYDNFFFPSEIMVGDTTLSNWIQILNQTLANQQAVIDSLQASLASQDTQLDSTMIADMIAASGSDYLGFGDTYPNPINIGTEYHALKDGFLTGTVRVVSNGTLIFYSDTIVEPNITRASFANGQTPAIYIPFTLPIRKGEYYKFMNLGSANSFFSGTVYFTELISSQDWSAFSSEGEGVSVSTFGDTLTVNGESVIVPGVSYLNVVPEFGSVTDASGNTYSTVDYGPAGEWMTENLKTENFANGDQIPMITSSYSSSNQPASWAWIDNNYLNEAVYGKSYNGNAITDSRNVCPSGWHIPSENEWIQLILLFGGETGTGGCNNCFGGDNLKSDIFWNGNNQSYMSIVPGGIVNTDGSGAYDGSSGYYWVNDYVGGPGGYAMHFKSDNEITESSWMYYTFLTVRCIKD